MTRDQLRAALTHDNVQAFLRVIRQGESSQDDVAYRMMFGGQLFDAPPWDHPNAHITKGGITSTAAGAYQFLAKTWAALVGQFGFPDFSPASQDQAAVALIAGRKALQAVIDGRLDEAIRLTNREWASLPGSPYGQPTQTLKDCREVFAAYGGREGGADSPSVPSSPPITETKPEVTQPMLPVLAALASPFASAALSALMEAAPQLIRLLGGGEQSEKNAQVAEAVLSVAKEVTGAVNEQQAAEAIKSDPEMAAKFREAVAQNYDQWMGMVVKFNEMSEASKAKAREFALAYDRSPVLWNFTFLELLSLIFVLVSASGAGWVLYCSDFSMELKGAVIAAVLIGGFNGVKEAWFGKDMGTPPQAK